MPSEGQMPAHVRALIERANLATIDARERLIDSNDAIQMQLNRIEDRAAITDIDKGTLPSFNRGEESIVEKYDDAIEEVTSDAVSSGALLKQKVDVGRLRR